MRKTENLVSLMGGALLGAAAMYLLDPDMGKRRREHLAEQAGDYAGRAGEAVQSGWENVADRARDLSQTIAETAEDYAGRLGHRRGGGSSWTERAKGWASGLSGTADDLRSRGRKWFGRYSDTAQDYASDMASDTADNITDYGNRLWNKVRNLGSRVSSRAEDLVEDAKSRFGEQHMSPVLPVTASAVGCFALGCGLMYLMDPLRGRSRRAWLSDKVSSMVRRTGRSFYRTGQDMANRAYGTAYEAQSRFTGGAWVPGEQLTQRVRSELGHVVSQPGLIDVMCDANGAVTLAGSVLPEESDQLIAVIEAIPGVNLVINRLQSRSREQEGNPGQNPPRQGVPQM